LDLEKYMFPCLSKTLFGVECLGCGFQRSFLLLLNGEFAASFEMYPALFSTLLFLGLLGFHLIFKRFFSQKLIFAVAIINVLFMIAGYIYKHF
jgi:hypothetical protein